MKGQSRIRLPKLIAPTSPVSGLALAIGLTLAIVFGAVAGSSISAARLLVGGAGGVIFFVIAMTGRLTGLRLIILWLILLGLIRRLMIPFAGWSSQDPLLLVSTAAAILLWWNARQETPKKRDALTYCTIFFLFVVIAQVFNPNQTIVDGALACIFWIPPLIWFFVGRTTKISDHKKVIAIIMFMSVPVALHGLYQNYFGLLPFEYTWVGVGNFGASIFYEGFRVRAFSTLVSPQEYGNYLSFALLFLWGTILAGHSHKVLRIALFVFLIYALFLQGSRSIFGLFVISILVTSFIWTRSPAVRLGLFAFTAFVGGAMAVAPVPELGDGNIAVIVEHQLSGLLDPTNPEDTGQLHFGMIQNGFLKSFDNPLGVGTAPGTTVSVKKIGSSVSTENDVSTIFVTLGVLPGIVYLLFLLAVVTAAIRRFHIHRSAYSIAVVGVFVATFGHVWSGGLYAVSAFVGLAIGGLSRPLDEEATLLEEEAAVPVETEKESVVTAA